MLCNLCVLMVGQAAAWISQKELLDRWNASEVLSTVLREVTDSPSHECPFSEGLTVSCYSFVWMFVNLPQLGDASAGP